MVDFDYLPPQEEQRWLLDELAGLIKLAGVGPLVRSPILLPTREFFPDTWTPDAAGVERLCRRLLIYAGLAELQVSVVTYTNPTEPSSQLAQLAGSPAAHHTEGAAAWFAGIEQGRCLFGVDTNQLGDSEALVGTMCHEVAHAFRAHHRLLHSERAVEELLTDMTTVFLGFGVLAANSAYLHRSKGSLAGGVVTYQVQTSQSGYLLTEAMCFLLATQAVVRRLENSELRQVRRALKITQEVCFKASLKALEVDPDGLSKQLGIPEATKWPRPVSLAELIRPLADLPQRTMPSPEVPRLRHEGWPVFRVRNRRPEWRLLLILVPLAASSIVLWMGDAYVFATVLGAVVTAACIGHAVTLLKRPWKCSEPECQAAIPPEATTCPGCGGRIAGSIRNADERLAARDALLGEEVIPTSADPKQDEAPPSEDLEVLESFTIEVNGSPFQVHLNGKYADAKNRLAFDWYWMIGLKSFDNDTQGLPTESERRKLESLINKILALHRI